MANNEIPQSVIDQANYDIVGVIGKRIDLKKAGKNWMACCPFHKEKSPSFSVNEDKGFYYCFGCGAGGDAVNFVVEYESLKFRDAVAAIVGNMPVNVTPEMVKQKAEALRVNYPTGNREDEAQAGESAKRLNFADQHPWLAARNTAPYDMVADLKGFLVVPVERNGKLLNMAALLDDKVKWLAGGPTYGATHNILPVNLADPDNFIHDNEIILCLDYADAWRIWWLRGGRSMVLAAIDPDNFIWMQYQQKHVFTIVADYAEAIADLEERGHRTFTIPPAYQRKEKALD